MDRVELRLFKSDFKPNTTSDNTRDLPPFPLSPLGRGLG
ncbi:hypothetical protein FBY12_2956 [Pseudomonas sp. SJZ131]|nr:hypothetical protein FBY12_2956 [Pseudomonas sp. SJZ131]